MKLGQSSRAADETNQLQQLVYNFIQKNALRSSLHSLTEFRKGAYFIFWSLVLIIHWPI